MMRQEAIDWFEEAQVNLRRAEHDLEQGDYARSCFAAQQAMESAMKALIIGLKRRRAPHTHDLTDLFRELADLELPVEEGQLSDISQYYVTSRYPSAGIRRPSISFTAYQAERAVEVAQGVVNEARQRLAL